MNTDKIFAENIANQYSVKKSLKVVQLKKLDRKVKRFPLILAYTLGIVFTLILGVGMCFVTETFWSGVPAIVTGSIIGVVGMIGMIVNYPIYKKILDSRKHEYAGDIIRIANEITNDAAYQGGNV